MRRPNSERNSPPSTFTDPRFSEVIETNTWAAGNTTYFADLRITACSAAEPAEIAVCDKYEAAQVWTTVASEAMHFPADQGMSVAPSGRLRFFRSRPDGCFVLGASAVLHPMVNAE